MDVESSRRFSVPVAAIVVWLLGGRARGGDLIFGDFENGLDPNLGVVQFNVPPNAAPNQFNGSVPDNATHGTLSGCFTTAPGFQQYLRYDNPMQGAGTVAGEINNYNDMAVDITVPGSA